MLKQLPQLLLSLLVSEQYVFAPDTQSVAPVAVQWHALPEHVEPAGQTVVQVPQWLLSLVTS